jgi:CBS domain-containing protein/ribosome-associated translation inhibitor RaiA
MTLLNLLAQSPVKEIIEVDFPSIPNTDTISKVTSFFYSSDSYEAIIQDEIPPRLVTVRDILKVYHPERTSITKIAIRPPSINPNTPIYEASLKLVRNNIRIVPVLEDDSLVGVVRQTKLLERLTDCDDLKDHISEEFMIENPITLTRDSSVGVARSFMLRNGISHAPVVDKKGQVIGIITAKNLIWQYVKPSQSIKTGDKRGEKMRRLEIGIKGISDKNPLTVARNTSISKVVNEMVSQKQTCALVVEKSKLIGIITPRDVISILTAFKPTIQIPVYMIGFKNEQSEVKDSMKRKVERVAIRGLKKHPNLSEIVVHGKINQIRGQQKIYSLKARTFSPSGIMAVNAKGWSMLNAFDDLCDKLDRRLRKSRGGRLKESYSRRDLYSE